MLKANQEYNIDGATFKCVRTINGNTFEVQMIRDRSETMKHLLEKATSTNFHTEDRRIKACANWLKTILKGGKNE